MKKKILCFILFLIFSLFVYGNNELIVSMMPISDTYKKDRKLLRMFSVDLMNAGFIDLIKYEKIHRKLKKDKIEIDKASTTNLIEVAREFNSEIFILPKIYFNTNIVTNTNMATSQTNEITNIQTNNSNSSTLNNINTNNITLLTNITFTTNIIKIYDFSVIDTKNTNVLYTTSISNTNEIRNVSSETISILEFYFATSMLDNISKDKSIGQEQEYVDFWIEKKDESNNFQRVDSNSYLDVGDSIKFNFELYEDGFVNIIYVSPSSTNISLLYPNNYNKGDATNNTILISNNIYQIPSESNNLELVLDSNGVFEVYLIYSKNNKNIYDVKNLTKSGFPKINEELKFIEEIKEALESEIYKKNYAIKNIVIKCGKDAREPEGTNLPVIKINTSIE